MSHPRHQPYYYNLHPSQGGQAPGTSPHALPQITPQVAHHSFPSSQAGTVPYPSQYHPKSHNDLLCERERTRQEELRTEQTRLSLLLRLIPDTVQLGSIGMSGIVLNLMIEANAGRIRSSQAAMYSK